MISIYFYSFQEGGTPPSVSQCHSVTVVAMSLGTPPGTKKVSVRELRGGYSHRCSKDASVNDMVRRLEKLAGSTVRSQVQPAAA